MRRLQATKELGGDPRLGDYVKKKTLPRLAAVITAIAMAFTAMPSGPVAAGPLDAADAILDPEQQVCREVSDTFIDTGGLVNGCVDTSTVNQKFQKLLGPTGLHVIMLGYKTKPGPSACEVGKVLREDGWQWRCVDKNGQRVLTKVKRWVRPPQISFQHTASPSRATVTFDGSVPLTGCRLSASDKRLIGGQNLNLSGTTATRTVNTASVPAGKYTLRVSCSGGKPGASADLLVRADKSTLLRSDCIDAWHDGTYADVVPGYGRRMTQSAAAEITTACGKLSPVTDDERARAGREAYLKIGQIAEREVRRVSAARGLPICEAVAEVFRPADTVGRLVKPYPIPGFDITVPVAGYHKDGYFPILNRQWTDGPVAMDNIVNCSSDNQSLLLFSGTWGTCPQHRMGAEPHQMYPTYAFEVPDCPSSFRQQDRNPTRVCIVWGDGIGNNAVGGIGKVFAANASNVDGGTIAGYGSTKAYDCQARALQKAQFTNVDVEFAPTLK